MIVELGAFALVLGLALSIAQAATLALARMRRSAALAGAGEGMALGAFLSLAVAFVALVWAFVVSDFSVANVAENSHTAKPLLYRIAGAWGSHEGSILLWCLALTGYGAAVAGLGRHLPADLKASALAVQGLLGAVFLAYTVFASNPFLRLDPGPVEGRSLNPLLQDPALALHPPFLYAGYVGLSVVFSFAVAALIEGRVDAAWARWVRPWTLAAWSLLTLGITLGAFWAYYELGWGGWWFWDPVENSSFMPWLVATALLHSAIVTEKRGALPGWTVFLALAAFSFSMLGAFLVRSGVLTSVHSFAADPSRGLFILVFLGAVIGGALLVYVTRAPRLPQGKPFATASRETLLLVNNLLLASACAMVLFGTLYPLLADALDLGKVSVGPPYFGTLFLVLMAPLVLLVPFGPLTRWQQEQASKPLAMLAPWFALALLLGVIAWFKAPQGALKTGFGVAGGAWVALGTLRFVWARLRSSGRITPEMAGMVLGHLGIAVFVIGALLVEAQNVLREVPMRPGETQTIGRHVFRFDGVERVQGPNYIADRGHVQVFVDDRPLALLHPEKRAYASGGQVMTDAGIHAGVRADVFVALGEPLGGDAWAVRLHIKPFVRWVWAGALLMMLGAFVTAADRRFRLPLKPREEAR